MFYSKKKQKDDLDFFRIGIFSQRMENKYDIDFEDSLMLLRYVLYTEGEF